MTEQQRAGASLRLTDRDDGATVDIEIAIFPEQLDRTKPSHIFIEWLAKHMEELMQRSAFDLQREIIAKAQEAAQQKAAQEAHNADVGVDFATPQPKILGSDGSVLTSA